MPSLEETYSLLRRDVLSRHFAFGRFWRTNLFTNAAVLGDISEDSIPDTGTIRRKCFEQPCVPRRGIRALIDGDREPPLVPDLERWRVWVRDRSNPLYMTGLRAMHLCVDHRLRVPHAARVIKLLLQTIGSLFKWPEDSPYGGYILRWDPVTDDQWEIEIDEKGNVTPKVPCRFLLNTDLKGFANQRYLYCTPRKDPRYVAAVEAAIAEGKHGVGQDRYRRWEPSKDEYLGLITAYSLIFDTFVDEQPRSADAREIIDMVRVQTRRVAKYLQRFGYLLVRPCGGVTARGCGEVLPLLEFPFGRVFERICGDSFPTSEGAYEAALATAGISPAGAGAGLPTWTASEIGNAIKESLEPLRDANEQLPAYLQTAVDDLDDQQREFVAELWRNQDGVDAIGEGQQLEPLHGYLFGRMRREDREKVFHQWFVTVFDASSPAEDFKPFIGVMLMNDDRYRRGYLEWFKKRFTADGASNPSPDHVPVTNGDRDTTLLTTIAMMMSHLRGDTDERDRLAQFVDEHLQRMARQLEEHTDATTSRAAVSLVVQGGAPCPPMEEKEGRACGGGAKLAAELHDKRGNYFGFLPALALAWRYLLDGGPDVFGEIRIPQNVAAWPEPMVPKEVIAAVHTQRMPVPLDALSASNPAPDDTHDVWLFRDPPPKPSDNDAGRPPDPRGSMEEVDFAGSVFASTIERSFDYPPLGFDRPEADEWREAPAFAEDIRTLVESNEYEKRGDKLVVKVKLRGVQISTVPGRFGPRLVMTRARLKGTYSLAWARQQ